MKLSSLPIKGFLLLLIIFCLSSCATKDGDELPLLASYDFEDGKAEGWAPNHPEHWQVAQKDGSMVYELVSSGTHGKIRAPTSWSLLSEQDVTSFVITGRLKCKTEESNTNRDMCVFFHYHDKIHFYYVHFSAISDDLHNIVGLVNGTDRIKINSELPGESVFRLTDMEWHMFKVTYDVSTGDIKAYMDDMNNPILTASDTTLGHGRVGIGSFDDTGYFDDIKLWGKTNPKQ